MYVVDVIPFAPGAPGGSLSYRSGEKLPIGSIVLVKLRKKEVRGVVVGIEEVQDMKASLKAASYSLSGTISKPLSRVPESLMDAITHIAAWHAAAPGSVLHQLLSEWISDGELDVLADASGTGFNIDTVEGPLCERKARYRTLISEALSRKKAALLVVSTIAEVEYWKKAFKDISLTALTGTLKDAKREDAIREARASRALVIATPHFAFAQVADMDTVIIDRVGAGGFRLPKRPYLDMRVALLELARARKLRIVYGDYPLPLEYRSGVRKLSGATERSEGITIVDATTEREEGESWSAVPRSVQERIRAEIEQGGRIAVFAARKGYAPVVVCGDCGQALKDERGKTYSFTLERGKRLFRTADGKSVLSTERNCPNCGSWNLRPHGVGIERVAEELRELFSDAPLALFDADTIRTAVGARRRLAPLADIGSIVVGTEAMAPWLLASSPAPFTLALIASADSLLALPFWRARERFLRLGLLLPSIAPHAMIATRLPDDAAVKTLKDPTDPVFFEEETSLRKALGYPPFGTLISLTWQGSEAALARTEEAVREAIVPYEGRMVPDRFLRGTLSQRTLVLSLPKDIWPDVTLSVRLASLPPSVRILIDPESFW
jgi:primosomal protein N'